MIKVYKLNDLIKLIFKIILIVAVIILLLMITKLNENYELAKKSIDDIIAQVYILNNQNLNNNDNEQKNKFNMLTLASKAINSEFVIINNIKSNNEQNEKEVINNNENEENNENKENDGNNNESNLKEVVKAEENAKVEKVENGITPRYSVEYKGVKIYNSTSYELTDEMMDYTKSSYNMDKVYIYHTHTCESYTKTEENNYEDSGNFRTTDLNYSVARVGDELENQLKLFNFNVVHDKTYHDYPAYNGSYSRSLKTAEKMIEENGNSDVIIDLHRDAIADETYAPRVKINGEYVSQLMFVIGSDEANKINSDWIENLRFAIKVQEKANEMYDGLFKPIILRKSEYNQHISKAACIIEVGATGNTLEESIASMKYLAMVLSKI